MLEQVGSSLSIARSPVDRALCAVAPALRIIGVPAAIVCVNATRNMLFAYAMLAVVLVMLALRPARLIAAILKPTLVVCALSLVLGLPAVFIGQADAPVRLVVKAFVSVAPVIALARTVPWNRLIAGLKGVGCPDSVIYVCDVTVQFIDILGRSMVSLLDALKLRSVGRDSRKLMSAGRVMGALFLRANTQARQMAEAMTCRGFDGRYRVRRDRLFTWPNAVYAVAVAAMIAFAIYCG
nr:energy-coupling factor transporter transmembrane component T [Bifidobacterium santillanense]